MYAFSRDGALPGSTFFHKVNERTKTPVRTGKVQLINHFLRLFFSIIFAPNTFLVTKTNKTVWLAATLSFILGLPSLGSSVAFSAATSIATIGLYISYGIPIALRLFFPTHFRPGPFTLSFPSLNLHLSRPVAVLSVLWISFISVVFMLPQENPVNSQTVNYAVVAVGIVMGYSLALWVLSARRWFKGPVRQVRSSEGEGGGEKE